jgi:hypothetical protein
MSSIPSLRRIVLQNKSSQTIRFEDLGALAPALQTQIDRDFSPMWGARALVFALHPNDSIPTGAWPIFFIDPSDEPNHEGLGVHLDPNNKPLAFVTDTGQWTITASHELLEMLADPFGTRFTQGPDIDPNSDGHLVSYLIEVGDPCEVYHYTINNIEVSDFVTPDYYHAEINNGVYDFLHRLPNSYKVPPGCYISWQDPEDNRWHQKQTNGEFVTGEIIDRKKNPREDRDSSFGEDEEDNRHNLPKILGEYNKKS